MSPAESIPLPAAIRMAFEVLKRLLEGAVLVGRNGWGIEEVRP
jgi:hypothetical protein